jgi:8-oxo-dGTP pyrophosphatase MutT (NUDIX family)
LLPVAALPHALRQLAAASDDPRAHRLSRFAVPPAGTATRQSAVLMAFSDGPDGPAVLLIQRAATLRSHAGQVAFPGGSIDATDASTVSAALREAEEEVGLDPASVAVAAEFPPLYIPVSRFVVTPVLAWWRDPHPVGPADPAEVARVELVPIAELSDPANRFNVPHPSGFVGPGFAARGLFVWGFTAILLAGVLELGGWARPWDPSVTRPLPAEVGGVEPAPPTLD